MCNTGMPLTAKLLRRTVYNYCVLNNIKHPFPEEKGMAGRKWMKLFLNRNPDIAARWSLTRNPDIKLVVNHYQKLRDLLQGADFANNPDSIYNIAEKECPFALFSQSAPLGEVERAAIVAAANAAGAAVPPLVIFKGQRVKPEWGAGMPPGTEVCASARGTLTTNVFIRWVELFSRCKAPGRVLLIFDGAASQLDANIIQRAEDKEIILCCLPGDLQPLDRVAFKCYESFWDAEVLSFWESNAERKMTRADFGSIFGRVWPLSMTGSNVVSGFRETGIYPFDPRAIPADVEEDPSSSRADDEEDAVPRGMEHVKMEHKPSDQSESD